MKIAIIGEQCSGKTTAANFIAELFKIHYIHKFADPIYGVLGCLGQGKNRLFMQEFSDLAKSHFGLGIFVELFEKEILTRELLEEELWLEKYGSDSWAIICDDLRYMRELELVKKLGFKVMAINTIKDIRQTRATNQGLDFNENHSSESEVQDLIWHADSVLMDSGAVTLELLKEHCQQTVMTWLKENI